MGLHEGDAIAVNGKRHRDRRHRGIYTSGTAVCVAVFAAQMGVSACQFSGQCCYELTLHALFSKRHSAVTNQSGNSIYFE